jgi:hypothetical protein
VPFDVFTTASSDLSLSSTLSGTKALRHSVRITTKAAFDIGSLFVMDALHVPYGVSSLSLSAELSPMAENEPPLPRQCATWPAFWTHPIRDWPIGGEIDIFEGVNLQSQNQVALHTVAGCSAPNATTPPSATGNMTYSDCTADETNHGCTYVDARKSSYGSAMASVGGGMYVAELASNAISVWWFPVSLHRCSYQYLRVH